MKFSTGIKTSVGAVALCCTVFGTTSCSLGPNDLPSVTGGIGDGYDVTLQFASVMNLPTGADIMMDGLRFGEVGSVKVTDQAVVVTAKMKSGTHVPAEVRAVIRQNTLLGDTYIALDHDATDASKGYLTADGVVPVARTSSPPQLEDTMAVLAYFVNGGSIQKVEDAMTRINRVMPAVPDVQHLASVVSVDLHDLAQNTGEIDRALNGFDATATSVNDNSSTLATLFSQPTAHYWRRVAVDIVSYIGQILPSVGSVYEGGLWMVPMFDSLADSGGMIRQLWDEAPTDAEKLSGFLRQTILPFAANPSVNITSVESPQGDQLIADVSNVLRMLGAVK
ncbi:MCE family protein [Nocardia sp. ET3-3]|uniref:MCE family protein n=1 Tax=Nocardia terrae TaxID=2675851 RepID=A0A7K1V269_9NOCA|nr:MlaD family protein [Nocardia terrae]MVU80726.1 MCE family protein [Nocardia terrae]